MRLGGYLCLRHDVDQVRRQMKASRGRTGASDFGYRLHVGTWKSALARWRCRHVVLCGNSVD